MGPLGLGHAVGEVGVGWRGDGLGGTWGGICAGVSSGLATELLQRMAGRQALGSRSLARVRSGACDIFSASRESSTWRKCSSTRSVVV